MMRNILKRTVGGTRGWLAWGIKGLQLISFVFSYFLGVLKAGVDPSSVTRVREDLRLEE